MSTNDWVPYTGPRGGKGWQHTGSGEIVYGDRPGGAGESALPPKPDVPKPADQEKQSWHPLGPNQWQHAETGEIVRSEKPPSTTDAQSIVEQARQPKKPSQPKEAARPKVQIDPLLLERLDGMPNGAQVLGWTKESPPGIGMTMWTKGTSILTTEGFSRQHGAEALQAALSQPTAESEAAPAEANERPFTPEEMTSVSKVSAMFGVSPGDVGNDKQLQLFLRRTARHVGFDPDSVKGSKADKAVASAEFLKSRQPHLEGIVKMAQAHGWGGGTARELAHRARHAGLFLTKTAIAQGYDLEGDSEQEHVAGAMRFLASRQQGQQVNPIEQIMRQIMSSTNGKRSTWMDVALAAVGFYLGWKLVSAMRRKASRRR